MHGDLAGGNVLLATSGADSRGFTAKVADFGLARILSATCETATFGTVRQAKRAVRLHMPPELMDRSLLSKATDCYSLGVLMWEMYCGQHAWAGRKVPQIIHAKTVRGERLALPQGCPPDFRELVDACMADDYDQRPSCQQAAAAITPMLAAA
ncbi:hypothetical protein CHLNCDRAFT_144814 [Chlorella variabilis]|uniref:Protein kinase domain-containing protein n=1 Tax=Chlorella variabilis TaxID=554065 RepID=E1ZD25_CHLVA|nr:hypothetical protein CHLNCDRAFT_144814 [Chlorella variabilis]EFN56343.1 hypothetical protein CHLNCDRAFT_144814 [Chlorella variabilis]|eukprot:XP_005848445.1 hypothetical protein CHLNCDRAFT_144814 [Chlorella variabilis]